MPPNTGAPLAELAALLDEETATELDDLLEETATEELDALLEDTTATELAALLDELTGATELETALDDVAPPQTAAVNCALFLPTPATCANLSFTHCGLTGA